MTRGLVGGVSDEGINWIILVSVTMVFMVMAEGIRMVWSQDKDEEDEIKTNY